jgi:hypothetical protein
LGGVGSWGFERIRWIMGKLWLIWETLENGRAGRRLLKK